jgi:hypothetical protein
MPDLIESASAHYDDVMSSLEEQLARAQEQVNEQRQTIAHLPAQSFEAGRRPYAASFNARKLSVSEKTFECIKKPRDTVRG